jgi:hypothetical protein
MNEIQLLAFEIDPVISKVKCPLDNNDLKLRKQKGDLITV